MFRWRHLFIISDRSFRKFCPLYLLYLYFQFLVRAQAQQAPFPKYFKYNIWSVFVIFDAPYFIWKFSVTLMLLMLKGFYVVYISLFEFGFSDVIIYFVLISILVWCQVSFIHDIVGYAFFLEQTLCSCRFFHWNW